MGHVMSKPVMLPQSRTQTRPDPPQQHALRSDGLVSVSVEMPDPCQFKTTSWHLALIGKSTVFIQRQSPAL